MPDITPVALSIQPAPSIGPTLSSLTQLGIQQTQLARQNALYGALAGGDPNEIAKWDPSMATAEVGYQKASRAFDAWKQYGAAAAAGDPQAQAALGARDPESLKILTAIASDRQGIAASAQKMGYDTFDQATKATNALGTQLLTIASEPDPAKRVAAIPALIAQAKRIPGATDDQIMPVAKALQIASDPKASPEDQNRALDVVAHVGKVMFASSADAQSELSKAGFGPTSLKPGDYIPGPTQAAMGLPLQNNALGVAAGMPQAPAPAPQPTAAPVPAPAPDPGTPASALAAGPGASFSAGAPVPDTSVPAPALPASASALGTLPTPAAAPPSAALPAVGPTAQTPAKLGGFATQRLPGGALQIPAGAGDLASMQATDLQQAASIPNMQKQQVLQGQTSVMLQALKNPDLFTGAGAQDLQKIKTAQQTIYSLLGTNDPGLNTDITDAQSFAKFANLAAATIAKQDVGARVTNFELSTFQNSNPGLGLSLQGNQRLLGVVDQVNTRNQAISDLAQRVVAQGGTYDDWVSGVRAYQDAHPIVDPSTGLTITTSTNGTIRGQPVSVTADDVRNGVLDNTYHLLPSTPGAPVRVLVDGQPMLYAGAATGRPGVTGAPLGARPAPAGILGAPALPTFGAQ